MSAPQISVADEKISAAKAAMETHEHSLALELLDELLADEPARMESISDLYVQALHSQAANMVESDPEQAKIMLLKALELDPANIACLTQLGFIYVGQKDHQNAIVIFQKIVAIKPEFAHAYFNLGYLHWVMEDFEQARAMYQQVIELKPEFLDEAFFNLAMIQNELGEQSECIKNLEQAIAINPANEPARAYLNQLQGGTKSTDES
jgi:tetratricopeptide (TPR) repeat protein